MQDRAREDWGHARIQRFQVSYDVPVIFTRDAFHPANPLLRDLLCRREPEKRHRAAFFLDAGVAATWPELEQLIHGYAAAHPGSLQIAGDIVRIAGGEACKNDPDLVRAALASLEDRRIDRHSYAVAIGGGAVLDLVGYAAAIFHRGVRHIRFPTTVLAQGDSGVGVKNGVNAFGQKNLVGTFSPPWAVVNDAAFIERLPTRGRRDGLSEAVKVALIRDRAFFEWIEANAGALASFACLELGQLIERSAALHMHQIAHGGDPFEAGSSRPLDFGHWSAHKLEMLSGHAISHGEAVAIGIALDARYSVLTGLLPAGQDARVHRALSALGFCLWHDRLRDRDPAGRLSVIGGLKDFQEHLGGDLTLTLLRDIGEGTDVHAMDEALIEQAVGWLDERRGRDRVDAA